MKKSVKILSAVMAVVLVFACGVGATLAYLHKETDKVLNTFSAQDLIEKKEDFVLKEHNVVRDDTNGTHKFAEPRKEVEGVAYGRVTPGEILPKNPFVRVKNVENAFLFIEIKNELAAGMTFERETSWEPLMRGDAQVKGSHGGDIFVKKVAAEGAMTEYVLPARAEAITFPILNPEEIKVADTFNPADATADKNVQLTFWAYLTQADAKLNTPLASWDAAYPAK